MNETQVQDAPPLMPVLRRLARKAVLRAEEALDEIPALVRRIRTFFLVATVSAAVFVIVAVGLALHRVL